MGRNRTATALKVIRGTAQKCRMNPAEPKYERPLPAPPDWLDADTKEFWTRVASTLAPGVAREPDWIAFTCLAQTWKLWKQQQQENAGSATIDQTERRLGWWLGKFGMTPVDRSKVIAAEKPQKDDWADL